MSSTHDERGEISIIMTLVTAGVLVIAAAAIGLVVWVSSLLGAA